MYNINTLYYGVVFHYLVTYNSKVFFTFDTFSSSVDVNDLRNIMSKIINLDL